MNTEIIYNLKRFVYAQESDELVTYVQALEEMRKGRKSSHWIWYIFPQIKGFGHSAMTKKYAIGSIDEAVAYLQHPVLGPRLTEITQAILDYNAATKDNIEDIMGSAVDALKFKSCMTLFWCASRKINAETANSSIFKEAIDKLLNGNWCKKTTETINNS